MRKENFFTGEVLQQSTSPPFSQETIISEQEAIQNASFGKYDYDPGARMMSQPVSIYPGGYGYGTGVGSVNPAFGLFMNPPTEPGSTGYPQGYYNPAYQEQLRQLQGQQVQYFVKPINFSGEFLPNADYEEEIERMKLEYWQKEQEMIAENAAKNSYSTNPYYSGYNYFGQPYYNPWQNYYQYNYLNNQVSQRITEMENEARENRLNLNMRLSKLAHNYLGDEYDEEELKERFVGKTIVSESSFGMTYGDIIEQNRFANLVPFDNSQMYRDFNEQVSKDYNSVIPKDSNMKDCFDNMGIVYAKYELEEEEHRRRNKGTLYNANDNSYKYFVRSKAAERYAAKNKIPLTKAVEGTPQNMASAFPTLAQSAKLCDDGTLNITCNFGSKAGQVYSVHNSQESEYDDKRDQFMSSISSSIYLDSPNPTT